MKTFSNGSLAVRDDNEQPAESKSLAAVTRDLERLIQQCSPELHARQKTVTSQRGDQLFVQVITTFRVTVPNG